MVARCCCGALRAEVSAEPAIVGVCHCRECQRRTGSVFSANAYFDREQVRIHGPSNVYVRDGQDGRKLRMHFCPSCGTTLFWELDLRPQHIGVAVGAFENPEFPAPVRSNFEESQHHWVVFDHELAHHPQAGYPVPQA